MPGKLDRIGYDGMAGDLAIGCDMHVRHDPVVVADAGNPHILGRSRIDGDIFTHGIAVADFQARGFAGVFFVLRDAADGAKTVERIVFAYGGMAIDDAVRADDAARAHRDVLANDAVRDRKSTRLNSSN